MKKIITLKRSFLILLVATVMGCSDWLDVRPQTEIMAYDFFQREEGFWDALNGIYISMARQNLYGANLSWGAIEFMAWQHTGNNDQNGTWYPLQRSDFEHVRSQSFINTVWSGMYNVISEINFLLFALEEWGHDVLSPIAYKTIKGEALALRAFLHFDLIRLFAPGNLANNPEALDLLVIPYVTEHTKHITPQRTYRETLDLLMTDVNQAIDYLSQVPMPIVALLFNINHLAALQLRARIAQWQNDPNTLSYALYLIDRLRQSAIIHWFGGGLVTPQNRVFPTELVFCLDVFRLRTFMQMAYEVGIGVGGNPNILTNTFEFVNEDLFELGQEPSGVSPADFRYLHWFENLNHSVHDWQIGRLSVKVRQPADGTSGANIIPLMRKSEPFLIAAEALIGVDNARAVEFINYLRSRRNNPSEISAEHLTEEQLRHIVLQEYRREFSQEGQLFFLYKRLGVERMPGMPVAVGLMTDERYTLPFPESERQFRGF